MTQEICKHKNVVVVGEANLGGGQITIIVRECQDCGGISLGQFNNYYSSWDGKPHWGVIKNE